MNIHVLRHVAVPLLAVLVLTALGSLYPWNDTPSIQKRSAKAVIGNVRTLEAAYGRWQTAYTRGGGDRTLTLALGYSKALSASFTKAHGLAKLDLVDGSLSVEVFGLADERELDLWLVDNRPGHSVKPEPGDAMLHLGRLKREGGTATLDTELDRRRLSRFKIDLVVVAESGSSPTKGGLLFGSPTLFQKLYYGAGGGPFALPTTDLASAKRSPWPAPLRVLVPGVAHAAEGAGTASLEAMIAAGADLFFNETFDGNGRTCATCHRAERNFTIDVEFIKTLPKTDPLFVAETVPALAENFENPLLMRKLGLFLENVDGTDDPANKFTMRGAPHTLALTTSLMPAPPSPSEDGGPVARIDGTSVGPSQRTGWSGDAGGATGTLREFAMGAIFQHFPLTLDRIAGVDFTLPSDEQLDAMEAFQLSLGRQSDLELSTLILAGDMAETGRRIFLDDSKARCNLCHANAGANASFVPGGFNFNFNTGVEAFPDPADDFGGAPADGGFGVTETAPGIFGNGTFNTPPLVEAADTPPFFHNNAAATIEEAVAFYNSDAFNSSPARNLVGPIELDDDEVLAIAAFLRVINALENIRSCLDFEIRALAEFSVENGHELLRLSTFETADAIEVLRDGMDGEGLHPGAVRHLKKAQGFLDGAYHAKSPTVVTMLTERAIEEQEAARDLMLVD